MQDKVLPPLDVTDELHRRIAAKFESLKAPLFYFWEQQGYGTTTDLSPRGVDRYYIALCNASSLQFMSVYVRKLRNFEIPINEYDGGLGSSISTLTF